MFSFWGVWRDHRERYCKIGKLESPDGRRFGDPILWVKEELREVVIRINVKKARRFDMVHSLRFQLDLALDHCIISSRCFITGDAH